VDLGENEHRTIVAGIAAHYDPQDLIDKQVVVVANLKPAKLMGVLSRGMLLAANAKDEVRVLVPDQPMPPGTSIR
jgi:methionyl-tRNA synthetase